MFCVCDKDMYTCGHSIKCFSIDCYVMDIKRDNGKRGSAGAGYISIKEG